MLLFRRARANRPARLQEGWVIANHILVSFHVAFISSVLALPAVQIFRTEVLRFIFASPETIVSALFLYISFHSGIALHEIGHWITAAKLNALNDTSQETAQRILRARGLQRWLGIARVFALAPYGKAPGIKRERLNYYPDAPYNLAVAAAGPRMSLRVALVMLPPAIILLALGLVAGVAAPIYIGRICLGIGVVGLLDFLLADPGKYWEFRRREERAAEKAKRIEHGGAWWDSAPAARKKMLTGRVQQVTHPRLGPVTAPWQFRNCGMGGRHTEKEYPESNISMQEAMFLILGATDYQEAQEMTVRLQNRLKEIIEKAEGCRVMGIGLEGGIAPYIERGSYPLPEVRLWAMMKQTIQECGYRPGVDVAIALDPAMSELETAYRKHHKVPDAVGMYLFWRDKALTVMDRDGVLDIYKRAIHEYDIPVLSIEDGFSENDFEGWNKLLTELGERVFVIGDDLVTTNDATIELAAAKGLINTSLIKANQIGSLYETILAMLVALGKGQELVVSHRSKSPNDDMEAQIALAANTLGLKAGGGANTERLVKYQAITEFMHRGVDADADRRGIQADQCPVVRRMYAYEEPTNAGVPTVGATVEFSLPDAGVVLTFRGATPLGTSAGSGEAIHLVDTIIERAEYREVVERHPDLFRDIEPGVVSFNKGVDEDDVRARNDDELTPLWQRTQRYDGKGCLNAVDNIRTVIGPAFAGRMASALTLKDIDRILLSLELHVARRRGKLAADAPHEECVRVMQRKQNLGMNAMLSASLAMARGIAHLHGKPLFELLREEMLSIVERLAADYRVTIEGSRFDDYVHALHEVNGILEEKGCSLHETLRDLTGIYREAAEGRMPEEIDPGTDLDASVPEPARSLVRAIAPKLGADYRDNAHHGLRHACDLLGHAIALAGEIDAAERVDWRVLAAAVCFHDIAAQRKDHGEEGAALAREILTAVDGMPREDIPRVEEAIRLHHDRSTEGARRREAAGLEAQLLYDVDQLEAFGVKGVYRYVAIWSRRGTPVETILGDARTRFESLTFDATRAMASRDMAFTETFFGRLDKKGGDPRVGAEGVVRWIAAHTDADPVALSDAALDDLGSAPAGGELQFATDFFRALRAAYVGDGAAPAVRPEPRSAAVATAPVAPEAPPPAARPAEPGPLLSEDEESRIGEVNAALFSAWYGDADPIARRDALHRYVTVKQSVARRTGRFGIANNRIFRADGRLFVPYLIGDTLVVHSVRDGKTDTVSTAKISTGTIITDNLLERRGDVHGEAIDLESELFSFPPERATPVRVGRLRDMAEQLQRINESANRNEAVYVLRVLVARLSLFSFKQFLSAKNLQSEVHNLIDELMRFLNTPLSDRLPFLVRILVRDVAGVVSKPKLIDRLWNDTIDLAEVHVRGSDIVNELRRSTHHAIGRHTMKLAQAYLTYLEEGSVEGLAAMGYPRVSAADEEARQLDRPKRMVERIIGDLEQLLGTSETATRIREWQEDYDKALVRCGFGRSLGDEVDAAVAGMHEKNRWTYLHHLRVIKGRVVEFSEHLPAAANTLARIDTLLGLKPDQGGFDPGEADAELHAVIDDFSRAVREAHRDELFARLEAFLASYERNEYYDTFITICELRRDLRGALAQRAFPEQRLLLYQLDCLLEEMGYLALRHVASEYEESGVEFLQCLDVIRESVFNLTHDGLHSRQLRDLAGMLRDHTRSYAEMRNVLEQIQRNYHHVVQRVIMPFERMREKLDLDEEELRIALANMQRYLHDLNSIASFTDLACAHVIGRVGDQDAPVDRTAANAASPPDPWAIVHLSHRDQVVDVVEADESEANLRDRYGGKGSGLIYISYLNVPTRDGFILPTTLPRSGALEGAPQRVDDEIVKHLRILETDIARRDGTARVFGDSKKPLLVAVRGGSVFSMPGMLTTVLFVGINDAIAEGMARTDPWCAYDSYRRFLASYGAAVWGVDMERYQLVDETKKRYGVAYKYELPWEGMKEITEASKSILRQEGHGDELDEILADPNRQLLTAVRAVFSSWDVESARRYREIKHLCDSWRTATIVQEMALGNRKDEEIQQGMDETRVSLTGVIPRTAVNDLGMRTCAGEFKFSAAGDDLVAGVTKAVSFRPMLEMETYLPMLNRRLRHTIGKLRRFMGTDQEIEFTVDRGVLSVLQSRAAEIGVNPSVATFEDAGSEAAHGIGVRGGAFRGVVAFDEQDVADLRRDENLAHREDVDGVLVVLENPSPDEIPFILVADGLLAAKGGSTSHAAIAVNGIEDRDFSAVMGVGGLRVHARRHEAELVAPGGDVMHTLRVGDVVSVHGTTGAVYLGSRALKRGV